MPLFSIFCCVASAFILFAGIGACFCTSNLCHHGIFMQASNCVSHNLVDVEVVLEFSFCLLSLSPLYNSLFHSVFDHVEYICFCISFDPFYRHEYHVAKAPNKNKMCMLTLPHSPFLWCSHVDFYLFLHENCSIMNDFPVKSVFPQQGLQVLSAPSQSNYDQVSSAAVFFTVKW